ncbi:MAG: hypothetical protein NTY03_16105 [Candidatus Bathyarchaeota archaeon]|nr:hypothetical protein [Candidatus Bathyarchaeota archaeon]
MVQVKPVQRRETLQRPHYPYRLMLWKMSTLSHRHPCAVIDTHQQSATAEAIDSHCKAIDTAIDSHQQ